MSRRARYAGGSYTAQAVARCAVLLLALAAVIISTLVQASTEPVGRHADQRLAYLVLGIISYTQWAQLPEPVHLCVVDSPNYFKLLQPVQNSSLPQVIVSLKSAKSSDLTQQCHVLFFEHTAPAEQQAIINQRGVRRILTMSLNNPTCAVGSSFCLEVNREVASFSVNLDSLKQSGVKISSKVLILSKPPVP